jgi:hypothetical protein
MNQTGYITKGLDIVASVDALVIIERLLYKGFWSSVSTRDFADDELLGRPATMA